MKTSVHYGNTKLPYTKRVTDPLKYWGFLRGCDGLDDVLNLSTFGNNANTHCTYKAVILLAGWIMGYNNSSGIALWEVKLLGPTPKTLSWPSAY
ncbi:hypothetical protein DPMN_124950 [Dreissena polymorpha]|uniref:Uncharacterized protein n=1 Tax=Dreissena polymorpha TaxID=45954 RepID=A0A9D4GX96_DREPO|nr:hypothetical protein DPMN_124950 [Dreissena polymorpha]